MNMRHAQCLATAAAVLLASAAAGCSSGSDDLQAARDRWERSEPDAYSYTYRVGGQTLTEARVTVDRGELAFRVLEGGERLTAEQLGMDAVFGCVADALRDADRVRASYDGTFGFPARVQVDVDTDSVDDEYTFVVKDFVAVRPA